MTTSRTDIGGLRVATILHDFIERECVPGTGITPPHFWAQLEAILDELAPVNRALLERRDELQASIDRWHQERAGQAHDPVAYRQFLEAIGYLLPEGDDFTITTIPVTVTVIEDAIEAKAITSEGRFIYEES